MDNDDKYAKFRNKGAPEAIGKYQDALGSCSLDGVTDKHVSAFFQNAFVAYGIFLIVLFSGYEYLGGRLSESGTSDRLRYCASAAEALGLLSLRRKIQIQGNVEGISGMTMTMYASVYFLRQFNLPLRSWDAIDDWVVYVITSAALLIMLNVLWSIFVTYRRSYQEEQDVLKAYYLIPACILGAALLRPSFLDGPWYSFFLAISMYVDMTALMPQIVFMMRGDGRVQAPVSNFVAATAVSKIADLSFWFQNMHTSGFYAIGDTWSPILMIIAHAIMVLLIADFMYHYLKAKFSGAKFSEDLDLTEAVCVTV